MSRRVAAIVTLVALTGVWPAGQAPPQSPQFRAATDVVMVDVSVRDGGRTVTGLRAEDFALTDNGVRQRIESVEAGAVPIDLTLVVDVSGNPRRPVGRPPSEADVIGDVNRELRLVAELLRPDDRVRLLAVDDTVQQVWSFRDASSLAVTRIDHDGQASLYDTLAAALLQPVEPARRHVVIARTKGVDTISSITSGTVQAMARQADALFHLVMMETAFDNEAALAGYQCNPNLMGLCWPTRRFWVPFQRRMLGPAPAHQLLPDGVTMAEAAESTGGALHKTTVGGVPSLTSTFRRTFEDFRNGYMLRYTPQGVARDGWHAIDVRVPASRNYTVRARRGYGIEVLPPVPAPAAIPDAPRTITELVDAHSRGARQQVMVGLRQASDPARLIRDFEEAGNPWPAAPRREATFAIEVAEAGLFSPRPTARRQAYALLERFTRLVRHPLEAETFERYWHFAVLTLLEGAIRAVDAEPFVERAIARFPAEPRFVLSRAIVTDQRWAARGMRNAAVDASGTPTAPHVEAVRLAYSAAIALPETTAEARVRLGWFLHRLGRHDEAMVELSAAGAEPSPDASIRYLRSLFIGHVWYSLDRTDLAVAAFREALTVAPAAQSARVALMNALVLRGESAEAEALAEAVQIDASPGIDPWWTYWQGQYRFYPAAMTRLQELSR
ncbi:MAG TPA: VWA domain-containing protein [Vicinamibacterales bacterium]|nr:VWA domain-containing protein [Vicinamibacterales bacterium]